MIWIEIQHLRSFLLRSMHASSGHDFLVGYIRSLPITPGGRLIHGARDRRPGASDHSVLSLQPRSVLSESARIARLVIGLP